MAFLVQGLGGAETCRTLRADGHIQNVQVALGTSAVMVSEATKRYPAMASACCLYRGDAHAAMQRALAHGAARPTAAATWPAARSAPAP